MTAASKACRYAIERLKEIVPIWKQENWRDGEVWVEGPPPTRARRQFPPPPNPNNPPSLRTDSLGLVDVWIRIR